MCSADFWKNIVCVPEAIAFCWAKSRQAEPSFLQPQKENIGEFQNVVEKIGNI